MISTATVSAFLLLASSVNYAGARTLAARKASSSTSNSTSGSADGQTFNNARFTFYDVGLGACGKTNQPGDMIVALNSQQYGSGYPGPNCFKKISITYKGKVQEATIMDECPGCPFGGLDFSRGLFDKFASEDVGVLYGSWSFTGGTDSDGTGSGGSNSTSNNSDGDPSNSGDECNEDEDNEQDDCDDDDNNTSTTSSKLSKQTSTPKDHSDK